MGQLRLETDAGGLRHYLDGKPVHCGTTLELQAVEYPVKNGEEQGPVLVNRWIRVRYEASLWRREQCVVTLYAEIGGHTAKLDHFDSMRFRWPV
jgi:hypothetical protein